MSKKPTKCRACKGGGGHSEPSCGPNGGSYWMECFRCGGNGIEPKKEKQSFEKGNKPITAPCSKCHGLGWDYPDLFDLYIADCKGIPEDQRPACPRCKGLCQDPDAPEDQDDAEAWNDLRERAEEIGL